MTIRALLFLVLFLVGCSGNEVCPEPYCQDLGGNVRSVDRQWWTDHRQEVCDSGDPGADTPYISGSERGRVVINCLPGTP